MDEAANANIWRAWQAAGVTGEIRGTKNETWRIRMRR
jgi:hypothetical protein